MEYSIKEMAKMAGISTRTLRYYDEIKLLKPAKVSISGYRIYTSREVNILQQILLYKELGFELGEIKRIIYTPNFNYQDALKTHLKNLLDKRNKLGRLIINVKNSLNALEGGLTMKDEEKFIGLKEELISENETLYGKEIRHNYGDKVVDEANMKLLKMSKEDYETSQKLASEILLGLKIALETNDPKSDEAQKVALLHQKWLKYYWPNYSKEAHLNLVDMYVSDERFSSYYDKAGKGATILLKDAVNYFLQK